MKAVFLGPAVLSYLAVFLYPTLRTTVMSFFKVDSITDAVSKWSFAGLDNYRTLFSSELFLRSMRNIAGIWLYGGLLVFALALLLAAILTSGVRLKSFFRAVIYLPNVISAVAMGTMWMQYVYSSRYGLLKSTFKTLGLESLSAVQWTSPEHVFGALLVAYCFGMVGYFMLIFMAGIEKIPADFYEVATIEGAGKFRQFRLITMPLMKGVMRTSIVLWTISTVVFFIWSMVFSPLNPEPGTVTPMVYMYQMVFGANMVVTERNVGAGAAVGVLLSLMVLAIFLASSKAIRDDGLEY
ncbi:MAG: sugar ABC transporter permease [Spirochaetaceae bacterium]|nr:sugar ABC transporter permease [Spirochaetaceae bacterium]